MQVEQDALEDVAQEATVCPTADDLTVHYLKTDDHYQRYFVSIKDAPASGTAEVIFNDGTPVEGITVKMKDNDTVSVTIDEDKFNIAYGASVKYPVIVKYTDSSDIIFDKDCTFDINIIDNSTDTYLDIGLFGTGPLSIVVDEKKNCDLKVYSASELSKIEEIEMTYDTELLNVDKVYNDDGSCTITLMGKAVGSCTLKIIIACYDSLSLVIPSLNVTVTDKPIVTSLGFTREIEDHMQIVGEESTGLLIAQAKRLDDDGNLVDYDDAELVWKVNGTPVDENGEYNVEYQGKYEPALKLTPAKTADGKSVDGAMNVKAGIPGTYEITAEAVNGTASATTTVYVDKLAPTDMSLVHAEHSICYGQTIDIYIMMYILNM